MGTDAGETPRAQAHHVTDSLVEVDVVTELEALRATDSYQAADHAAKTIAKQPGIRVVLIALKRVGHMHEHTTPTGRSPCSESTATWSSSWAS